MEYYDICNFHSISKEIYSSENIYARIGLSFKT